LARKRKCGRILPSTLDIVECYMWHPSRQCGDEFSDFWIPCLDRQRNAITQIKLIDIGFKRIVHLIYGQTNTRRRFIKLRRKLFAGERRELFDLRSCNVDESLRDLRGGDLLGCKQIGKLIGLKLAAPCHNCESGYATDCQNKRNNCASAESRMTSPQSGKIKARNGKEV